VPVYVDDMYRWPLGQFGRMKMSHMIATDELELHTMAERLGVARRWHQHAGSPKSHYDISQTKRDLALQLGAIEISLRQYAQMVFVRSVLGSLPPPEDAEEIAQQIRDDRKQVND
jgi:hypothetical protein